MDRTGPALAPPCAMKGTLMSDPLSSRAPAQRAPEQPPRQYLAFGLNRENYALEIRFVKEILPVQALTGVPLLPAFVRGVINLRGAVVPVCDLAVRFGQPPTPVAPRACFVILELPRPGGAVPLGILVDQVSEVLELSGSDLEPAPAFGDQRSAFIHGVGKVRGGFVILLDAPSILSAEEFARLDQVPRAEGPQP